MANNFKKLFDESKDKFPEDLDRIMADQVASVSMYGKMTDVFGPCALRTFTMILGGAPDPKGPQTSVDDWRRKPVNTKGLE
jgi:hypothetical protein